MRMLQPRNRLGLAIEALFQFDIGGKVRRQHLDGNGALETDVAGTVDFPHAASSDCGLNLVGAEPGALG
jgi:hypothetical protein